MFEDRETRLGPINFFAISSNCHRLKSDKDEPTSPHYALPSMGHLCHEENFATAAMGWCEEGIALTIKIGKPIHQVYYPDVERGDSVELFFDTRDLKSAGFNTRFCHHFFFLPQPMDDRVAGEITRFRTEDTHSLCDSDQLQLKIEATSKHYIMKVFIPANCLYGYDPKQFARLGFTYRINRYGGKPQHFSVLTREYPIDQQPSLWGSLNLVE